MTNRRLRARRVRASSSSSNTGAASSRQGPRKPEDERKDFLIQARVPRDLDDVLKREAKRRRLSVSHLIRNVLEDTFELVDGVLDGVDGIVQESVGLATQVTRDATKIARGAAGTRRHRDRDREQEHERSARDDGAAEAATRNAQAEQPRAAREAKPASAADARARAFEAATADVYAWNPVVLNREARCVRCETALAKGKTAHLGLSSEPSAAPRWICPDCLAAL